LKFWQDASGIVLVYALFVLVPILGVAGLAVDSAHLTYFKTRMQNVADAAALAAVMELPRGVEDLASADRDGIVAVAQSYAAVNMPSDLYGDVVPAAAVEVGFLDTEGSAGTVGLFYPEASLPAGSILNAVRVSAMRTQTNGNAIRNMFVAVIGGETSDVVATAIALNTDGPFLPPCVGNGVLSLGSNDTGQNSVLVSGSCLHADGDLKLGQNTCVQVGDSGTAATFSVSNLNDASLAGNAEAVEDPADCGTTNAVPVELTDLLNEASISDYLVDPSDFIFDLSLPAGHPDHVTNLETFIDSFRGSEFDPGWPDCEGFPASGRTTLDVNFGTPCVAIVDGDLILKRLPSEGGFTMENVMLLVKGQITFSSDAQLGMPGTCEDVASSTTLVIASEGGSSPAKLSLNGTQLIFGGDFHAAAQGDTVGAAILSAADTKITSNWEMTGCPENTMPIEFEEKADLPPPPIRKLVF
jgi:Flp pilus assembly protein TadG